MTVKNNEYDENDSDDFNEMTFEEWMKRNPTSDIIAGTMYDYELSKFCVNHYSYDISYNEGGGEVFDSEISLIDKNILEVFDLQDDYIVGNVNILK